MERDRLPQLAQSSKGTTKATMEGNFEKLRKKLNLDLEEYKAM
jgi:hypothetical protein